ncbi:hypothetical protein Tco_0767005 [Tanacetum coccineum]
MYRILNYSFRDSVMSSSSTVTYTFVYTDSEPGRVLWGADEELSNRGYDDDEPFDDDDDYDDTNDEDEEPFEDEDDGKEKEHLAPADSSTIPIIDLVPSAGDTEAFETDKTAPTLVPSPRRNTTRIRMEVLIRCWWVVLGVVGGGELGVGDVWVDPTEAVEEVALTTLKGVNARVTKLAAVQEQDTQDIYAMIEDVQDRQTQLS